MEHNILFFLFSYQFSFTNYGCQLKKACLCMGPGKKRYVKPYGFIGWLIATCRIHQHNHLNEISICTSFWLQLTQSLKMFWVIHCMSQINFYQRKPLCPSLTFQFSNQREVNPTPSLPIFPYFKYLRPFPLKVHIFRALFSPSDQL